MRDAGIPVVVLDSHRSLDNVGELIHQVADALGVRAAGDQLAKRTQQQIDDVTARIASIAPAEQSEKLRMVFLYVRGQSGVYYMFGEGSGADSLIDAIGGYDVAAEIDWNGMKPLTDEGLVAAQPDLVLMMTAGLESAGGVDGLLERLPALAETPAGQHRRFVTMDDSQILGFGPIAASVLESLAVATYAPAALK
jgi:iron complex transport system substrate-binding protein